MVDQLQKLGYLMDVFSFDVDVYVCMEKFAFRFVFEFLVSKC